MVHNPNALRANTCALSPTNRIPRARWLVWISVALAVYTFLIAAGIEAVSRSILVVVFAISISLGITAVPLLVYIGVNGVDALRLIKVRLMVLACVILIRLGLELTAMISFMLSP